MMSSFVGKNVLVSGGTRGIGLAVSRSLIDSGAFCIITGRNENDGREAEEYLGGGARYIRADVTSENDVNALFEEITRRHGRIDAAVNCAGVTTQRSSVRDLDVVEWKRVLEINLIGPLMLLSRQIAMLSESEGGSIVNVSSCAGLLGQPRQSAYSTSKAALNMLTQVAAIECANPEKGHPVRINAVCPGPTLGGMNTEERLRANPASTEEKIQSTAMKRFAQPAEVTAAITWLLSSNASYVTGALIPVDGGFASGKF